MAKHKCGVCGYIFDEESTGKDISEIDVCPFCHQPVFVFSKLKEDDKNHLEQDLGLGEFSDDKSATKTEVTGKARTPEKHTHLDYPKEYIRIDPSCRYMNDIHRIASTSHSVTSSMGTQLEMPGWDDILILGTQLNPFPLEVDTEVKTQTIIGKNAKQPMVLESPFYVSHMSFGAISRETKIALAKGSAMAKTAMCSGEGGILPEEMENSYKYIFEYVPNKYSVTSENLKNADAIEIKIGQSTKPGLGGHLPGNKVTPEIAKIRGKKEGEDIQSPSRFKGINSKDDLKELVSDLREKSEGRPIGIKIAAGRIENDLEFCIYADVDFVTVDGRGGATGSSPKFVRDSTSIPTIFALRRARKYLDKNNSDIDLIITGGLRVSADFAKAIALGADAIAIATAPLMAVACQQYRICGTGECPVGVATQDPELRDRLKEDAAVQRVANFFNRSLEELKEFARITGHSSVHDFNINDICTLNSEISNYTDIDHV
ncbi:MAG: FMN-binding glutamate synthase family protein [Methanobacteriaceae archaeon]